jgi:predicted GIY-YIG superfamily endonuclease
VPFFVYILKCADDSLYVGSTANLERRVARHNDGLASQYTACRRPVQLVYSEERPTPSQAVARERQLKRWSAAKKRALTEGHIADLKHFARRRRR